MPKIKTKKIIQKRFRLTKTGKIMYRTQGLRHLRRKKDKSRQRRQNKIRILDNTKSMKKIRRFLAI